MIPAKKETLKISPSSAFEERVKNLLRSFGFQKINGGPSFLLGDNQIDACGICEKNLLVIECTTQRDNLRQKIETFKGKISSIRRGLDQVDCYCGYNSDKKLRFVLASRYSSINQYTELAKEGGHKVILWDPKLIAYYEKVAKAIPFRARYDLLADLEFDIPTEENIVIPALKIKYHDTEMYNFFISPDNLVKISYVARRETGRTDYYQRMIDPSRLSKIRKNFLEKKGIFPTNIVIGINKAFEFKSAEVDGELSKFKSWLDFGYLKLPTNYQSCWIIDGQHRLFSFRVGMDQKLAVLAFGNISLNKQAQYFVEINKTAKPISSMLLWDLESDLRPQTPEGILSAAAKKINCTVPFQHIISIPSEGSGKISIASFCSALLKCGFGEDEIATGKGKTYVKNPFFDKNYKEMSDNISLSVSQYYNFLLPLVPNDKNHIKDFLFDNGGFSIMTYLLKIIVCIEGKVTKSVMEKYLVPVMRYLCALSRTSIVDCKRKCSSEGGKKLVLNDFLKQLTDEIPEVSEFLTSEGDLLQKLIDLEGVLRNIVIREFKLGNFRKYKSLLNQEFVAGVEKNIKIRTTDEVNDFCTKLTMGQIQNIITRELWNSVFKKIFVRPEDSTDINDPRFPNEMLFKIQLDLAVKARNSLVHTRGYLPTRRDSDLLESFMSTVEAIVASIKFDL